MSTTTHTPARRSGVAAKFSVGVAFLLVVALLVFVLQNTVHTTINVLGWNFDIAQGVALLGAALVGAVIALIVSAAIRLRRAVR
ncbi:MAG: LapA family protein [Mycobacterium kyogaense]|uniref:LapA family protein n=1 Tax=Mycobacterium kyogaense TaxID=2212479 RepID=UPI002FF7D927